MSEHYVEASLVCGRGLTGVAISWFGAGFFDHVDTVLSLDFCKAKGLQPRSLLGARSDWYDHGASLPDGYCDVNDIPRGSRYIPPGVRIRPPDYAKWTARLVLRIPCTAKQAAADLAFGLDQIGKPYELPGLLASFSGLFGWRPRDWRDPTAWWCSELRYRQWEIAGIIERSPLPFWRITPGDVALAGSAIPDAHAVLSYGLPKGG